MQVTVVDPCTPYREAIGECDVVAAGPVLGSPAAGTYSVTSSLSSSFIAKRPDMEG